MIKREHYLSKIRGFYDSDLIKIITGIRRCGKSVILTEIKNELSEKTDNVIFLDFEDASLNEELSDCNRLLAYVEKNRKKGLCYVLLDEVQRVDKWAEACRTLRIKNCSVFISGSNSKLLSSEFTKELSGRYVSFRIRPFVYAELKEYAAELGRSISVSDYLVWGGFPKRVEFPDESMMKVYLNDLNETIIINDIIRRFGIRKTRLFRQLANYVFLSNSRVFSARNACNYLKTNGEKCSVTTVIKYMGYLEDAFATESVPQFSVKAKHELNYYRKSYNADVSLNSIRCKNGRFDITYNMENIVYNELLYRDFQLNVYNNNGREIDFIAVRDGKTYFIQVAYTVADEKTYEREFSAFAGLSQLDRKIIITNDEIDYSTSNVQHIKFKDFLNNTVSV